MPVVGVVVACGIGTLEVVRHGEWLLDENIDNIVLNSIHYDGKYEHHENDLDGGVAFSPSQSPVAYLNDKRYHLDEEEDTNLHS